MLTKDHAQVAHMLIKRNRMPYIFLMRSRKRRAD